MKILVVTQYVWPESFGINELARSLVQGGHTINVLTGKPNYPEGAIFPGYSLWTCSREVWQGINIYRVPIITRGSSRGIRLVFNYLSFIVSGMLIAPWMLRKKKYDVILVYAPSPVFQAIPASFIGWLKRCPVALWVQDLWPDTLRASGHVHNSLVLSWVAQLVKFTYHRTDLLLVQSKAFEAEVRAFAPRQRVLYYPNSVEPEFYNPPEMLLPDVPALNGGFSVVFAGNLGWLQAVEVIVEAARLLREQVEIRFVVFGSGSRLAWMRQEAESLGLTNLHLVGRYPVETMPGLMRKASVLLVTLGDQKSLTITVPNKVQAYMAVGRPIVASLNGEGARVILESGAGMVVPAKDGVALANAVLQLYRAPIEERERYGQNGRNYYMEHFNHDRLVAQLIEYLQDLNSSFGKTR